MLSPPDAEVKTVKLWGIKTSYWLCGIRLYDNADEFVIKAGDCWPFDSRTTVQFNLEPKERLVGIRSKTDANSDYLPVQHDPVFVIGR